MNIDQTDELTNKIMDIIRDAFHINPDSNKDDVVYTRIWNLLRAS